MRKICALALLLSVVSLVSSLHANPVVPTEDRQPAERQYWWQWWRPAPRPPVQRTTAPPQLPSCPFVLEMDDQTDQLRLVVPRNLLKDLKVAEGPMVEPPDTLAESHSTILSGVFLTLAFASGGLWIVRRGVPGVRTVLIGAGLLLLFGGTLAWADIPPFGGPRRNDIAAMVRAQQLERLSRLPQITVEVIEQADVIKLIVGRDKLAKLTEPPAANP